MEDLRFALASLDCQSVREPRIARSSLIVRPPDNSDTGLVLLTGGQALGLADAGALQVLSYGDASFARRAVCSWFQRPLCLDQ